MDWPVLPVLHADWSTVSGAEAESLLALLEAHQREHGLEVTGSGRDVIGMRAVPLPFYPGHVLIEVGLTHRFKEEKSIISFVVGQIGQKTNGGGDDGTVMILNGTSPMLHNLNKAIPIQLSDESVAAAYLRFFCGYVWGDDGGFWTVESVDHLPWKSDSDPEVKKKVAPHLSAIELVETLDDGFRFKATVLYGGLVFLAKFRVENSGTIEMEDDDRTFGETLPLIGDRRDGFYRILD